MDVSKDLAAYFGGNPIAFFRSYASGNNWEISSNSSDKTGFYIEGMWQFYFCYLHWLEASQQLQITCEYELKSPEKRFDMLYKTLNLANEKCNDGYFTYSEEQKSLRFHNQFKGSDALEIGEHRSKEIVLQTKNIMDETYPVFQLISWGNENPESAIKLVSDQISGYI